jgi:hypothetical protein
MYRIGAVTACAAALMCIAFNAASAAGCDDRVVGSCAIEPVVEAAETNVQTTRPLAYARTGKGRGVQRARRASRYARRVERRRPAARTVQVARTQAAVVAQPRPEIAEASAPPAPATILPTVAAILPPAFVRDASLDGSKLEAGWNAADAPEAPTAAASAPAEPGDNSGQAPAGGQAADYAAETGPPRTELVQAAALPTEPADTPWMRFAILMFGGLLALGSAIRMFV